MLFARSLMSSISSLSRRRQFFSFMGLDFFYYLHYALLAIGLDDCLGFLKLVLRSLDLVLCDDWSQFQRPVC